MNKYNRTNFDLAIIGGGFYGCMIALFLSKFNKKIILIEKEAVILKKASYNNQARVHNGYHYPRSFLTALRSHANFLKFNKDFKQAICKNYLMIYAIAKTFSKTTSQQFLKFCQQIDSKIYPLSSDKKRIFDPFLIEDAFSVEEYIFDAAILRKLIEKLLIQSRIQVKYSSKVTKISEFKDGLAIDLEKGGGVFAKSVFNCSYSGINDILQNSGLSILPLKHEFTEMPLLEVSGELKNIGITVMDGPFFGILPFPDRKLHTIHHVRYTPRFWWNDTDRNKGQRPNVQSETLISNYLFMIKDAQRYVPSLKSSKHKGSLYETRTILMEMEQSDGRPILFRRNYGFKNFHIVLGSKIDNVYDVIQKIRVGGL